MIRIYCPVCYGSLELSEDQQTAVCKNCGRVVRVPKGYTELESSFLYALEARKRQDFQTAGDTYTQILRQHPDNAAAYWGRALSRYEIEYQSLPGGQHRLICHQAEKEDFAADPDVRKALELAEGAEKEEYLQERDAIGALQKEVSRYAAVTRPYDVIILGGENPDSVLQTANVEMMLKTAGLSTFCPSLELTEASELETEARMFRAFSTASTLVYVAAGKDSFPEEALFQVKRFLRRKAGLKREAARQAPMLLLAFDSLDEYEDIPDLLFDGCDEKLQMALPDFGENLCSRIQAHVENYGKALRAEAGSHDNYEYSNLLKQARLSLEDGNFEKAKRQYDAILNFNPQESQAYWGLFLASWKCRQEKELIRMGGRFRQNVNYRNAVAFASERERQTYQSVIEEAEKSAGIQERQKKEAEQEQKRLEEERRKKQKEVEEGRRRKAEQEEKARRRAKKRLYILTAALAVVLLGAGALYVRHVRTVGPLENQYKEAMNLYASREFSDAAQLFEQLEDYKDSRSMYTQSMVQFNNDRYASVLSNGENLVTRDSHISILRDLLDYVPEAQDVLDGWLEEGLAYYEEGKITEAYYALRGFGTEVPEYVELWRDLICRGLISSSENYGIAAIMTDGSLAYYGEGGLDFEGGVHRSVSLSRSGFSGGAVRGDGTVYLRGNVALTADVSSWTEMVCIAVTDEAAAGLREDGTLWGSWSGAPLAEGIRRFTFENDVVMGVRRDGTVYSSSEALNSALADWTNISYAIAAGPESAVGVTAEGGTIQYQYDAVYPEEVVAVFAKKKALPFLTYEGTVSDYEGVFLIDFADGNTISVDEGGFLRGYFDGSDQEKIIAARKFVRDEIGTVGLPYPGN